jgi:hypothetical protein
MLPSLMQTPRFPAAPTTAYVGEKTNLYDEKQVLVEWAAFYDLTQSFCSFEGESNTNGTTTFHTKEASGILFLLHIKSYK